MLNRSFCLSALFGFLSIHVVQAAGIQIADAEAYLHANGALVSQLGLTSNGYFSTLDSNNFGTLSWTYTNTTASTLTSVNFFGFLDADIDRDLNTFFNEYGVFNGLSLPANAPAGAIAATSWQIDEPGFVYGTILNDLAAGLLKNDNFVPSSAPDDVSLAFGFPVGSLAPGQTATLTLRISPTAIGGLQQIDPDSDSDFFFNGYATSGPLTPASDAPEPGTWLSGAIGASAILFLRKRSPGSRKC